MNWKTGLMYVVLFVLAFGLSVAVFADPINPPLGGGGGSGITAVDATNISTSVATGLVTANSNANNSTYFRIDGSVAGSNSVWGPLSPANLSSTAYGSSQHGWNNGGTMTIGSSSHGANQWGLNLGTMTIGTGCYGSEQIGSVQVGASAVMSARGALQLFSLLAGQSATTTVGGVSSILLGAGISSNAYAIVAGDTNSSHGDGSITANSLFLSGNNTSLRLVDAQANGASVFNVDTNGSGYLANYLRTYALRGADTASPLTIIQWNNGNTAVSSASLDGIWIGGSSTYNTRTNGYQNIVKLNALYNQTTGVATNTDLLIARTETSIGTGPQKFFDCQVGGVSKFNVDNAGNVLAGGSYTISGGSSFSGSGTYTIGDNQLRTYNGTTSRQGLRVIATSGNVIVGTNIVTGSKLDIVGETNQVQLTLRSNSIQTSNLVEILNAGALKYYITSNGLPVQQVVWDDVVTAPMAGASPPVLTDTGSGKGIMGMGYLTNNIAYGNAQMPHGLAMTNGFNTTLYIVPNIHWSFPVTPTGSGTNVGFRLNWEWSNITNNFNTLSGTNWASGGSLTATNCGYFEFGNITNNGATVSSIFRYALTRYLTNNDFGGTSRVIVDSMDIHAPLDRLGTP